MKPRHYIDGIRHKQCPVCSEWKPEDAIHFRPHTHGGYRTACRDCENRKQREVAEQRARLVEMALEVPPEVLRYERRIDAVLAWDWRAGPFKWAEAG